MRALFLSWEYPPVMVGGLGRHVYSLSKALVQAGHEVTVVTRHAPGAAYEEYVDGVRVIRAAEDPPLFTFSGPTLLAWTMALNHTLTRAALRAADTAGFDVIHAHDWLVAHSAMTLREHLGIPLVTTIHATEAGRHQGWLPADTNRSIHSTEWWLANESDRVVVCSHYMRWEVNQLFGVPHQRIDVVANGVDPELWRSDPVRTDNARRAYAGDGPLIGFAGRLVYEKGVQDLITALPAVRAQHPGLRLIVAGDGPHRQRLVGLTESLGLEQAVSFTGFLGGDLPSVMAATDAMVVPSIYEPFGMIALETAATGTPIAAASTGGLKEIVEPGRTGMNFPAANPEALATIVSKLLADDGNARRMARTAQHVVIDRFSWSLIARRTGRVYATAVAGASSFLTSRATELVAHGYPELRIPEGNLLRLAAA
ncbi:glycosyltransferase family 4 protein [Micromonospora sp. NPDC048999]|uniref:glycosyltransferase family 4 protein n=1 Tax=Micromonospora sp. NPDC048999 TaxID=3155391 RepID=UPI0034104039